LSRQPAGRTTCLKKPGRPTFGSPPAAKPHRATAESAKHEEKFIFFHCALGALCG
jgi:hypothetical protein